MRFERIAEAHVDLQLWKGESDRTHQAEHDAESSCPADR